MVTSDWRDLMTGFAFDGQVNGDTHPGGFIETDLTIHYRLPASSCERIVDWEADLHFALPNGARTLGHPGNRSLFYVGAVVDPLGVLSVPTAVVGSAELSGIVEVYQAHGALTRTKRIRFESLVFTAGSATRPHRDNITENTRLRRFAVTISLNDDYEGGGVKFAEFGEDIYKPPPGCALVFFLLAAARGAAGHARHALCRLHLPVRQGWPARREPPAVLGARDQYSDRHLGLKPA